MCETCPLRDTPHLLPTSYQDGKQRPGVKAGHHSPGCRHTWQWATFFTTPSDTCAFSSFHWMNLRWAEKGYHNTICSLHVRKGTQRGKKQLMCYQKGKKDVKSVCVSYLWRSVCPFSIWISLRACSLPTPGMPLWMDVNAQVIHISDFDTANFRLRQAPYLRNIITAKEDGQTNKILSGEM